jgi:uncharacterized phage protein gp47/JayE
MSTTSLVPVVLPTLAPTIDASGIRTPSYDDILNSLIASFQQIYGSDIYLEPDSQDFQLISVFALAIHDTNQAFVNIYNGMSPNFAQGANLSSLVKINGIARKGSTNSTVTLTITGVAGTQIVSGLATDTNGNQWVLPLLVTIPASGGIDVGAIALQAGNVSALANTITVIATPVLGWQTVNNAADALPGSDMETDAELRIRQAQSTSLPAQTPIQSILAAVSNLNGVNRSAIYENNGGTIDANGLPPHSISVVVDGGDSLEIAQTIEAKKTPGTDTFGTTSITVQDPAGLSVTINYFTLVQVPVYVTITIRPMSAYASITASVIATAVINFINTIPIGDSVYYNWLLGVASLDGNVTFRVIGLTVDVVPNPTAVADVFIAFNQAPVININNVTILIG